MKGFVKLFIQVLVLIWFQIQVNGLLRSDSQVSDWVIHKYN